MKKLWILIVLAAIAGCSETPRTKEYYLSHRSELAEMQVQCRRVVNAGSPNCQQAGRAAIAIMFGTTDKEKS